MTSVDGLRWEDPPPDGRTTKYQPLAAALRERPGEWALVPGAKAVSQVTRIRQGVGPFAPRGAFEATMRKQPDGTIRLWARYVGEQP